MVVIVSVGRVLVVVSVAIVALSTYISQAQELDKIQCYSNRTDVTNRVETVVVEVLVVTVLVVVEAGAVTVEVTLGSGNLEEQND